MCLSTKLIYPLLGLAVSACGDGGGGGSATSAASAEGLWQGQTSSGYTANIAILENGGTWGIYSSGSTIYGAVYGQATVSGNNLAVVGTDFNLASRTRSGGTYTGTYSPKASMTLRNPASGVTFNGAYRSDYDAPASLASLAGTFTGSAVTATKLASIVPVAISSSGALTVPASNGCAASGQASPRPSGKNVFDLSVTFTGTTCVLGNGATVNGVAYFDAPSKTVLALALNAAHSDGFIFVGTKP